MSTSTALYLARQATYAAFLSAADSESSVCWRKADGQYPTPDAARAAQDVAYTVTRDAYNRLLVEPMGPHAEARIVIDAIRLLGRSSAEDQDWHAFKQAREDFVDAARVCLSETLQA
ncbi:hypothetical protein OG863_08915 [Streptomyces decoyicus]|uniref:Uncharacterized protein n=1 Tax=Streptomyces decoyicus TaxID=249567 RepID=A0ABZ1FCH7_9ACTN|nr:hypothetical protein [Streptomyces decoyicus]WSB68069.1 hypothetical protein OG863_08915 [Streptomyces decoyicus]